MYSRPISVEVVLGTLIDHRRRRKLVLDNAKWRYSSRDFKVAELDEAVAPYGCWDH